MNGTFTNPILAGDYADPSIIRVGDVYYMTHSSFPYGPGLLLWQSKNLVDWQPIVRALRIYDGDVWAPELVHHNRRFYIYYPTGGKNHVIWADSIEGPWSDPIDLHVGHIDPGHVVASDGTRYLHLSGGHLVQLTDDGLATVGEVKKVYDGWPVPAEWRIEGNCLESPKLIFRDGYYHLISAQGGTAGPSTSHMIVHARSRQIDGPWENSPLNPILRTKRREDHWWSRGHGTLIDTPAGDAYIVYHAYERGYQTLGRQVLLQPVTWTQDGWLRVEGDPSRPIAAPPGERLPHGLTRSDDFATPALGLQWQFWAGTGQGRVQIEQGTLRMTGAGESPADCSPMVCMAADHAYEVEV
ncbi:MAG: family 43 glycosylhydrolase, partial [Tepidisphaeraceae bacterium]